MLPIPCYKYVKEGGDNNVFLRASVSDCYKYVKEVGNNDVSFLRLSTG